MPYLAFIVLHAAAGVVGFIAGIMLLARLDDRSSQRRWFFGYTAPAL